MDLSYMKTAEVGIPEDLERLKWTGRIKEYEKTAQLHLQREDLPEAVKKCIVLELRKMKVNAAEYPLTEEELIAQFAEVAPGFCKDDLEKLALDLDWAYVEGEKRYFGATRSALLKSSPLLRNWPGLKMEISDGDWVRKTTSKIKEQGRMRIEAEVEKTIEVSEEAAAGHHLRIDIPFPSPKGSVMKAAEFISAEGDVKIAGEDAYARTAVFEADGDERRSFSVRYRTEMEIEYRSFEDFLAAREKNGITSNLPNADIREEDLSENSPAVMFTPFIRALSEKIVGDETDKIVIAKKIYDYMLEHYRYSYVKDYAAIDSVGEYFALRGRGDCGLQSMLFITLCRYNGIPARWESGLTVDEEGTGCHDWALVYLEGTGWRPVDCSFGGGAMVFDNREGADFYFGNIDPYRIIFNTMEMAEFEPPKKQFRFDPYDSQVGEGETEERMLETSELKKTTKLIYCREI